MDNRQPSEVLKDRRAFLTRVKQADRTTDRATPRKGIDIVRSGKELVKTGMIASATAMVLTGFRSVKPLNPLHRFAGMAFLGFSLWHVVRNEKIVRGKRFGRKT